LAAYGRTQGETKSGKSGRKNLSRNDKLSASTGGKSINTASKPLGLTMPIMRFAFAVFQQTTVTAVRIGHGIFLLWTAL
jgi:hypothetical protein